MADNDDLFGDNEDDDVEEPSPARVQDDLFGSDSEDEQDKGEDADEDFAPAPAAPPPTDLKSKLALLAQKKKREAEGEAGEQAKKKRKKKDKEDGKGKGKERRKSGSRAVPSQDDGLPSGGEGLATTAGLEDEEEGIDLAAPSAADAAEEEDEERELVRTAEDDAFIDDEGVEPGEGDDRRSESDGELQAHSEAEEEVEDEFEKMFSSKGRKRRQSKTMEETKAIVEALLAKMEVAAEADIEANEKGRPAVNKLKMLPELEGLLSQRVLHRELLDAGVLGVLKAWIEPMPDFSLPNISVRSAVLRHLGQLPIDVADEGRKEQLRKSGIGKVVLFLFKLRDETPENRRMAKDLVEKWSRPIFEQHREPNNTERVAEREAELRRAVIARQRAEQKDKDADDEEGEGTRRPLRPGDPGFRWHASIPAPARLDYIKRPASKVAVADQNIPRGKKDAGKVNKRLVQLQRKKVGGKKGSKVSVEGRGLII